MQLNRLKGRPAAVHIPGHLLLLHPADYLEVLDERVNFVKRFAIFFKFRPCVILAAVYQKY